MTKTASRSSAEEEAEAEADAHGGMLDSSRRATPASAGRRRALRDTLRRSDRRARLDHRSADSDRPLHWPLDRFEIRHRHFLERAADAGRCVYRLLVRLEMDASAMNYATQISNLPLLIGEIVNRAGRRSRYRHRPLFLALAQCRNAGFRRIFTRVAYASPWSLS